ncbi:MAG: pyrroline-5-carboxylate reductase, partial [Alphaproteobacteria bacterium RIFCSPHIGHO2_12_FULL_45_9]
GADYHAAEEITTRYDVIILAVKPQVMADVANSIKHLITPTTLILSIAAGKTISFYESIFGTTTVIVRAMPNTPALVAKGMTVLCGNDATSELQAQLSMNLMASVGDVEWIDDETLMDAVTAVSGSGPAYVFHLIEAMTEAGVAAGLTPALSEKLARQTVIGAASLAESENTIPAATLRQNVTSPGGTTEAALKILMSDKNGLADLMTRAILAAQKRGKELAS